MPELTDREKARDLGNQSAALARSIADVLNDTLDALEAAEKECDRWRAVACNVKDGTAAAEAERDEAWAVIGVWIKKSYAATAEVARLNHDAAAWEESHRVAENRAEAAEAERDELGRLRKPLIVALAQAEAERDRLVAERQRLTDENDKAVRALREYQGYARDLRARAEAAEAERDDAKVRWDKWTAAEARVAELEKALRGMLDEHLRSMPGVNPDGSVSTSSMAETLARAALAPSATGGEA